MEIGVAHAARLRLNENLTRPRRRNVQFPEYQRFSELLDDGGLHLACHG
jgi:hypothetical protein